MQIRSDYDFLEETRFRTWQSDNDAGKWTQNQFFLKLKWTAYSTILQVMWFFNHG